VTHQDTGTSGPSAVRSTETPGRPLGAGSQNIKADATGLDPEAVDPNGATRGV